MSIKNCNTKALTSNSLLKEAKSTSFYKISKKTINLFENSWPKQFSQSNKQDIITILNKINRKVSNKNHSKTELKALLMKHDGHNIINQLNDAEYYLMLDLLEQPVFKENSTLRLKEHVNLENSTNIFSTEIYREFVTLAQAISTQTKPKILVLTASARDPFEAVDFYQSAFTQAGANTLWLPLDATLNTLIQQKGERRTICKKLATTRLAVQGSINREAVYPDLTAQQLQSCLSPESILKAINNADGIFINGGDQSLTLRAFKNKDGSDNAALSLIKEKLASNSLIIGGTSAGTAVMSGGFFKGRSIAMITNGQSNTAIVRGAKKDVLPQEGCNKSGRCDQGLLNDDLTYNSLGGLGLFTWGITDTHFSERGRQGRLAKLALDTNTRFAFGVDEATALVVSDINTNNPTFNIVGQSGVFIVDNKKNNNETNSILSHYLTRGDSATINAQQLEFSFADWKSKNNENVELPKEVINIFDGKRYQQSAQLLCRTSNTKISANSKWENKMTKIQIIKQSDAMSRFGLLSNKLSPKSYCSYQNYRLSFDSTK